MSFSRRSCSLASFLRAALAVSALALAGGNAHAAASLPRLQVSANGRFLVKPDGKPFFYLADTGWELFHRLNREEAVHYLDTRARQKFTVIQAVALAELDGLDDPNAYGDRPLVDNDPLKPAITPGSDPKNPAQYDYWDHVDFIVDQAAARGIYIALLPSWGRYVNDKHILNTENGERYGRWIGERYAKKNVIWVLGGDRNCKGYEDVWRAVAKGIAIGASGKEDYDKVLMTLHPCGSCTSSTWFHDDAWLDFDMQQNGHNANVAVWDRIGGDYNRKPTKPVMDGEPLYEDHPISFNSAENGYSVDADVRKFAYWDLFAGAHGHTYGHHAVWQMYAPGRTPINGPTMYWFDAIERPGANEMRFVRALIESRPMLARVPDPSLVVDPRLHEKRLVATRGDDYAFIYSAEGRKASVTMGRISGSDVRAAWYNPRTGRSEIIGTFENKGVQTFQCPSQGWNSDWVLILDDASKNYPLPGLVTAPAKAKPAVKPTP